MRTFAKINDRGRSDHEHMQNTLFGKPRFEEIMNAMTRSENGINSI